MKLDYRLKAIVRVYQYMLELCTVCYSGFILLSSVFISSAIVTIFKTRPLYPHLAYKLMNVEKY